jgi:hypothetical protein
MIEEKDLILGIVIPENWISKSGILLNLITVQLRKRVGA